ncbi:cyclic nucleotide-binding domain-containing protein [Phenylobacterium sp.]|uniref:Crp/Fnr family transcriptional regulator n=1 Tax=Phenylobacterium sp. TaxID=1871053 RepID=UPI00301B6C9E
MSEPLLDLCRDLPVVTFADGEALLTEGATTGRLFVLVDGVVEVAKGDHRINTVAEPGAVFGEMSVLLEAPHMATVRALGPVRAHVSEDGGGFIRAHPQIAHHLARVIARRLNGVTAYLVDLKTQYEAEAGHLGFVDEILECLLHQPPGGFTPGSDRDPG